MDCRYHPGKASKTLCDRCKEPLCDQCAIPRNGRFFCSRCIALEAARDAVDGIDRRLDEKKRKTVEREGRQRLRKKLWQVFEWGIVGIGLLIMVYQVPDLISVLKDEKPLRKGTYKTDSRTDDCIRNLWKAAKLLQEGKNPGDSLVCPASNKPFLIKKEKGDVIARCPNPELYGFREMRVSKKMPVPEVIK
jgi:hypothetical protein